MNFPSLFFGMLDLCCALAAACWFSWWKVYRWIRTRKTRRCVAKYVFVWKKSRKTTIVTTYHTKGKVARHGSLWFSLRVSFNADSIFVHQILSIEPFTGIHSPNSATGKLFWRKILAWHRHLCCQHLNCKQMCKTCSWLYWSFIRFCFGAATIPFDGHVKRRTEPF